MALVPRPLESGSTPGAPLSQTKWLIIRFRAIGDNVMAGFVATAIRTKYPDAHITWVTEKGFHDVIDTVNLVDELVVLDRKAHKANRWSPATWMEQLRFYTQFRKRHFDYGIDLQGHLKTEVLLWLSKPKKRVAVWATDVLSKVLSPAAVLKGKHRVEHGMSTLWTWEDFTTPERPIMPTIPFALPQTTNVVSINTGASMPFKFVPLEVLQGAADRLSELGYFVVGIGGPGDPPLANVHDLCGKTSLAESLGIIRQCACHICGDTGTGHIAAAYGVPFVSCFVDLRNHPDTFRPYSDKGTVLMPEDVTVEKIVNAVLRWAPIEKNGAFDGN